MRKMILTFAAAASALAIATPAAAQWAQPAPYGYGNQYGQNNWGYTRSLQVRIDNLQRRIAQLDNRDRINEREARRLREDARQLERRLRMAGRNGLSFQEARNIEYRLRQIEARLVRDAWDGRRWGQGQYGNGYYDRDRDGYDDRWENDRRDRDGRRN